VQNIIKTIRKQLDAKLTVVATGGLSSIIAREIPDIDFIDPELTLNGLRYLYELNEEKLYGKSNSA
jgi:type III pantothenate kinase